MHEDRGRPPLNALALACVCALILSVGASCDVALPAVVGDNMVLQQEAEAPLWGWAEPGEQITVSADWLDADISATADESGHWMVRVATPAAGGPYRIRVTAKNEIVIENVMIGEVWVCSGQSNMWWPVNQSANAEAEIAAARFPDIRMFTVGQTIAAAPEKDCAGTWEVCNPQNVPQFSAVGYYYARELHRELRVPIGMIHTSWGGTPAEAWTGKSVLAAMEDFAEALALVERTRTDPEGLSREYQDEVSQWWRALSDAEPDCSAPDLDDSDWATMDLPGPWEKRGLEGFDGVVWFRKEIEIPTDWEGKELILRFGPIDDMDTVWLNGVRVAGTEDVGHWRTPRRYTVRAAAVTPGENVIALRVVDTGWAGGFSGEAAQLALGPAQEATETSISLAGQWRYRAGLKLGDLPPWPHSRKLVNGSPAVLYNGMIAPLIPYSIRGVIWYQGEANRSKPLQYRTLFPAMVEGWRQDWGQGDFPFYFVQIAPFGYAGDTGQAAELREAQAMALDLPNTGMVVTTDIGNPRDIHPRNKQEVGRRLSLWALAKTYGREDIVYSGPLYRSMKIEDDAIRVFFDHIARGLAVRGVKLTHFEIAGEDRRFYEADAVLGRGAVLVSSPKVKKPVAVRFAWSAAPEPNLFNAAILPAAPFRTDDWPSTTADED